MNVTFSASRDDLCGSFYHNKVLRQAKYIVDMNKHTRTLDAFLMARFYEWTGRFGTCFVDY